MALKSRKTKILGALVIAGVLIAVGYISSSPTFSLASLLAPATANAESTQALLQEYAEKTGPNGVPLWEQQLIDESSSTPLTNATTSVSLDTSLAGAQAAPDSLTDQFAQSLFSQYLTQEGGTNPSESDIDSFAQQAIEQVVQNHEHEQKFTLGQINVSGTGAIALEAYAVNADKILDATVVPQDKGEISYFSNAVEKNDSSSLKYLAILGNAYSAYGSSFIKMSVPTEAENAHLEITNDFANLGEDITDMSFANTDPLRAYIGFQQYETDAPELNQAFADMFQVFAAENAYVPDSSTKTTFYKTLLVAEALRLEATEASSTQN